MKYNNIKKILKNQVENKVKSMWTFDEVRKEFTQIYQNYTDGLRIYTPQQLLDKIKEKENDHRVPEYYKGKEGYEARKVCDNFDLTYHLATATTYILRAYHKHETPVEDITKAIAHLEFELEKIKRNKK